MNFKSISLTLFILLNNTSHAINHLLVAQNSPDAAARTLYSTQLRRERNKGHSLDQLFLQLQGDNRVGMASEHPLKYFMTTRLSADEACQLTLSPVTGTKHLKAWAVPKDSPYADILNYWYRQTSLTYVLSSEYQSTLCPPTPFLGTCV
jgi:hypothetical protein